MKIVIPSKRDVLVLGCTAAAAVGAPAVLIRPALGEEKGVGEKLKEIVTGKKRRSRRPRI